jgi:hypothetical protein
MTLGIGSIETGVEIYKTTHVTRRPGVWPWWETTTSIHKFIPLHRVKRLLFHGAPLFDWLTAFLGNRRQIHLHVAVTPSLRLSWYGTSVHRDGKQSMPLRLLRLLHSRRNVVLDHNRAPFSIASMLRQRRGPRHGRNPTWLDLSSAVEHSVQRTDVRPLVRTSCCNPMNSFGWTVRNCPYIIT